MADLLERIRHVWDDHQERDKEIAVRQEGEKFRDQILSHALELKGEWSKRYTEQGYEEIHDHYHGRLEGLNLALKQLHAVAPHVDAQLDVREFQHQVNVAAAQRPAPDYETAWAQVRAEPHEAGREVEAKLRPPFDLSNEEIVAEARDLHSCFKGLSEQYKTRPIAERLEIREQMEPLVNRERELRQEYTGRVSQEISKDRVPELQVELSR